MNDENNPAASGAEVEEVKTEASDAVAAEQKAEEVQEPAPEKEIDYAKAIKKMERRINNLTKEKYTTQAERDALKKILDERNSQNQSQADDIDDIESVIERKVAEREQKKAAESFYKRSEDILSKAAEMGDFDVDDIIPLPRGAADAIVELDKPEIFAYLQENPELIDELEKMSPYRQAVEIGKLDAKLSAPKPVKKSAAPPPITPVGGSKSSGNNDLYAIENTEDWIKERNRQARG